MNYFESRDLFFKLPTCLISKHSYCASCVVSHITMYHESEVHTLIPCPGSCGASFTVKDEDLVRVLFDR